MRARLFFLIFVVALTLITLQDLGKWHWSAGVLGQEATNLYNTFWWFDMPMHFLWGLFWGFAFVWLHSLADISVLELPKRLHILALALTGAFVAGLFVEVLQFLGALERNSAISMRDTASDLASDAAGGIAAFVLAVILAERVGKPS